MEDIKLRSLRDRQKEKLDLSPAAEKPAETSAAAAKPRSNRGRRLVKKAAKLAVCTALVFFIGGLGGVWLDRIMLPTLLVKYPGLNQYDYLKRMNERTTIIHETEEVSISQEEGATAAIERVRPSIIRIMTKDSSGQYAEIGTGIILTSDGYILTPLKNIYSDQTLNTDLQVKLYGGSTHPAQISAQNPDYSLAILKIDESNLPVIPYADSDSLQPGERLIIVDDAINTDIISRLLDNYVMPGSTASAPQKRIQIVQDLGTGSAGAAIINVEGKLVGIGQEANIVIPLNAIKSFIDQGVKKQ